MTNQTNQHRFSIPLKRRLNQAHQDGKINLPEDDPDTRQIMPRYLYCLSASESCIPVLALASQDLSSIFETADRFSLPS